MSEQAAVDPVDAEVRRALAEHEAGQSRVYYDADADASVRGGYYAAISENGSSQELPGALAALLERTHAPRVAYKPTERVYPWVDLHPDGQLRSVYSGKRFSAEELIRADADIARECAARVGELARTETTLGPREFEEAFEALEAQLPFNCEHVLPQSWFSTREPMRGDLHHLFACESRCNSFRNNTPYGDFPDARERSMSDCGRSEASGFEPAVGKGPVARTTLYFLLRYPARSVTRRVSCSASGWACCWSGTLRTRLRTKSATATRRSPSCRATAIR